MHSPRANPICLDRIDRGVAWGTEVARAVLAWRATDGFGVIYSAFTGGTVVGQWRPTPPAFGAMSAQGLAFTSPFVVPDTTYFRPVPPRTLASATYAEDFNAVKALGRRTGSTRTEDQSSLAVFWEGNASVHWNQAANQMARSNHLSIRASNRLLAVLNIAMADTAFTIWSAKRHYGSIPTEVTWRPVTAIPLAATDGHPETAPDRDWLPLVTTPSHPDTRGTSRSEWRRGNGASELFPASLSDIHPHHRGAGEPDLRQHRARALGREHRSGVGWHALPKHGRDQRRCRSGDRRVRESARDAAPVNVPGRFA